MACSTRAVQERAGLCRVLAGFCRVASKRWEHLFEGRHVGADALEDGAVQADENAAYLRG
eukprot:3933530-Rhodomonas_salina.1